MVDGAAGIESVNLLLHTHWIAGVVVGAVSFVTLKLLQVTTR